MTIIDLGQISAVKVGGTAPLNKKLLWYDEQVQDRLRWKFFDSLANDWKPLVELLGEVNDNIESETSTWSSKKIQNLINTKGVFTEDIQVRLSEGKSLGAFVNGQVIPTTDKSVVEVLKMLAQEVLPPIFVVQPSATVIEIGNGQPINVEWSAQSQDGMPLTSITIGTQAILPTGQQQQSGNVSINPPVTEGVWKLNSQAATLNTTINKSIDIEFAYPIYYADNTINPIPLVDAEIKAAATKFLASSKFVEWKWTIQATSTKFFICVPPSKKLIAIVDTTNLNIDITSQFESQYVQIADLQGDISTYTMYTLSVDAPYGKTTVFHLRFQ